MMKYDVNGVRRKHALLLLLLLLLRRRRRRLLPLTATAYCYRLLRALCCAQDGSFSVAEVKAIVRELEMEEEQVKSMKTYICVLATLMLFSFLVIFGLVY
eukprot:COSAG02_NODE_9847_length_2094_cov_2.584962_2_plen_99_part_01